MSPLPSSSGRARSPLPAAGVRGGAGSNTTQLVLTGSIAHINTFIACSKLTYTTAANAISNASMSVEINDGGNTGSGGAKTAGASVTLGVTAVNDAPVNRVPLTTLTMPRNERIVFSAQNGNAIQISDVDSASSNLRMTLTAEKGALVMGSLAGLTLVLNDSTAQVILIGTLTTLNNALHRMSYYAMIGFSGNTTITIRIDDLGNTGTGGSKFDFDEINVFVKYPPVQQNLADTVNANTPLTVSPHLGLLVGATNPNRGTLTAQLLTNPAAGALTLRADGSFTHVPQPGYYGSLTFTYRIFDGSTFSNPITATLVVLPSLRRKF